MTDIRARSWVLSSALVVSAAGAFGCADPAGGPMADGTEAATDDGSDTGGTDSEYVDGSEALFDPDHLVEVQIELAPDDWDALRQQTRDFDILMGEDCQDEPFGSPFTYFEGDVIVDGELRERVGVRKKGFLGSLDEQKPSLKLKFHEFVDGQSVHGVNRMTLNNNKQDPAFMRQCIAYSVFSDSGVPAPRCNFAHVTVNGVDLGVFAHVEEIKKPFLRRHFDDDEGSIYEGTLSDFREDWTATFDKKTNKSDPAMPEIDALVAAVEGPPEGLADRVDDHIDVDEFIRFWAAETLISHWDGYAGNTNNYYIYAEPGALITFMPWGVDEVIKGEDGESGPAVLANGVLAHQFYADETMREQYRDQLAELLATAWDEDALLDEVDRMEVLILPYADESFTDDIPAEIDDLRTQILARRSHLEPTLSGEAVPWDEPLRDSFCFVTRGALTASFDTTFASIGSPDIFGTGAGSIEGEIDDAAVVTTAVGSQAGANPDNGGQTITVQMFAQLEDERILVLFIDVPPDIYAPQSIPVEFMSGYSGAIIFDPAREGSEDFLGGFSGVLEFDNAESSDGGLVQGTIQGELIEFGG